MSDHNNSVIAAVVAAFNPDDQVLQNLRRVMSQVDRVIVVDDGSGVRADDPLLTVDSDVEVVRLSSNSGIAAALNVGAQRAIGAGADLVLTLDQDSTVAEDYVHEARTALIRLRRAGRSPAIIAAGVQSGRRVRPVRFKDRGEETTPTLEAIQSGLVIPSEVFERVGWFDESLFIDCVDTDFVLRAAAAGVPTYLARRCAVEHPLGRRIATARVRATRSGERSFAFHPPWRRYYITRNRAIVLARYGALRPAWMLIGLAGEMVQLMRCLVFGPQKLRQGAAVVLGLTDALRRRRGRLRGTAARVLGNS